MQDLLLVAIGTIVFVVVVPISAYIWSNINPKRGKPSSSDDIDPKLLKKKNDLVADFWLFMNQIFIKNPRRTKWSGALSVKQKGNINDYFSEIYILEGEKTLLTIRVMAVEAVPLAIVFPDQQTERLFSGNFDDQLHVKDEILRFLFRDKVRVGDFISLPKVGMQ